MWKRLARRSQYYDDGCGARLVPWLAGFWLRNNTCRRADNSDKRRVTRGIAEQGTHGSYPAPAFSTLSPNPSTPTRTVSPSEMSPRSSESAILPCSSFWMSRFKGRAP